MAHGWQQARGGLRKGMGALLKELEYRNTSTQLVVADQVLDMMMFGEGPVALPKTQSLH